MYYNIALENDLCISKEKKKISWSTSEIKENQEHTYEMLVIGSICSELTLGSKQIALSSGSQTWPHNMITCGDFKVLVVTLCQLYQKFWIRLQASAVCQLPRG